MHVDRICRLQHGVYNLARVRDAATSRYARFQIPSEWMQQDTGVVSQVSSLISFPPTQLPRGRPSLVANY
jgi:hypothetical protein